MNKTFPRVHYEGMWSPYEKCREIVKHEWKEVSCWNESNLVEVFKRKSNESLAELKIWSSNDFYGRKKKLQQLRNKLEEIKDVYSHFDSGTEIRKIKNQIDNILLDEEIF